MNYRSLVKKRNKLWYEYKILSNQLMDFSMKFEKSRKLYYKRVKVHKKFTFYQKLIEEIDNEKKE